MYEKILGIKHIGYVNKAGRPVEGLEFHMVHYERGPEIAGVLVSKAYLSMESLKNTYSPKLGDIVYALRDERGNVRGFHPINEPSCDPMLIAEGVNNDA